MLLDFLDVVMFLYGMEDCSGGVARFGSRERSGGAAYDSSRDCPACSGDALRLQFSVLPFFFGFYLPFCFGVAGLPGCYRRERDCDCQSYAGKPCKASDAHLDLRSPIEGWML
jgi:hypothetical protein